MAGDHRRDRDRPRNKDHDRDRGHTRDKRDVERSRSRDREKAKFRSRKDEPRHHRDSRSPPRKRRPSRSPARRSGRDRDRSASPRSARSRSPPRKHIGESSGRDTAGKRVKDVEKRAAVQSDSKMDVDKNSANGTGKKAVKKALKKEDAMDIDESEDSEATMMAKIMGFANFRSTKQTKVPNNDWYGVRKEKKIEYRQYMNRVGGFNRPLSPSR